VAEETLYFAYTSILNPRKIASEAPSAEFRLIAHLPETKLIFPHTTDGFDGVLPSVIPEPGNTVWGALFVVDEAALAGITASEKLESRVISYDFKAVDREGKRHSVVTHVFDGVPTESDARPSKDYMSRIITGARHWSLPAGWIAGLDEYLDDPPF
jgi:gamma-glutamylcyclotransferase